MYKKFKTKCMRDEILSYFTNVQNSCLLILYTFSNYLNDICTVKINLKHLEREAQQVFILKTSVQINMVSKLKKYNETLHWIWRLVHNR